MNRQAKNKNTPKISDSYFQKAADKAYQQALEDGSETIVVSDKEASGKIPSLITSRTIEIDQEQLEKTNPISLGELNKLANESGQENNSSLSFTDLLKAQSEQISLTDIISTTKQFAYQKSNQDIINWLKDTYGITHLPIIDKILEEVQVYQVEYTKDLEWFDYVRTEVKLDPEMIEAMIRYYDVKGKLAQGFMGATYLAEHRIKNEERVIKFILPNKSKGISSFQFESFIREAELLKEINHPNIVKLINFKAV